jgi:hypothetical protein
VSDLIGKAPSGEKKEIYDYLVERYPHKGKLEGNYAIYLEQVRVAVYGDAEDKNTNQIELF